MVILETIRSGSCEGVGGVRVGVGVGVMVGVEVLVGVGVTVGVLVGVKVGVGDATVSTLTGLDRLVTVLSPI